MFYYVPSEQEAYNRMLDLRSSVHFGFVLRNVHKWAAEAMVVAVILHMARVFFTGAYKKPREFNWVIGIFLLLTTLVLSFTGYLLPWDQIALWAITVGTKMAAATPFLGADGPFHEWLGIHPENDMRFLLLGDSDVGANALLRFLITASCLNQA